MTAGALTDLGVGAAADAICDGRISSLDLVEACLARIDELELALEAWAFIDADGARSAARACDASIRRGEALGLLHGVPLGIKDIIDVAGMPTTAGAAAFAHRRPTTDAALVARLRAGGAVILGKTHATQFAYRDPAPTTNPWDRRRTPGGSSSGSAAAVAARMVPGAIGTQTVGSILRPSAYCGIVGLKGPHGQVPLDGVVPLAWSLDHGGSMARSVADAARLFGVLAGTTIRSAPTEPPRIAVSRALLERADPPLRTDLDGLLARAITAGAVVETIELPTAFDDLAEAGRTILAVEAAAYHRATFAVHAADYGPTIAELIRDGLARGPDELTEALRIRDLVRDAMRPLLDAYDALLTPVAPDVAPLRTVGTGEGSLCAPWSTLGVPAISLPTGLDEAGLPFAVQLVGGLGGLDRLLGAAVWVERLIGFEARPAV